MSVASKIISFPNFTAKAPRVHTGGAFSGVTTSTVYGDITGAEITLGKREVFEILAQTQTSQFQGGTFRPPKMRISVVPSYVAGGIQGALFGSAPGQNSCGGYLKLVRSIGRNFAGSWTNEIAIAETFIFTQTPTASPTGANSIYIPVGALVFYENLNPSMFSDINSEYIRYKLQAKSAGSGFSFGFVQYCAMAVCEEGAVTSG